MGDPNDHAQATSEGCLTEVHSQWISAFEQAEKQNP